jgi:hypothetical protein
VQCLQDAIARIHHELRTRTWFSIHELLGDDGQEYQTPNLRHDLGLSSTQYDILLREIGYHMKKGVRDKWESLHNNLPAKVFNYKSVLVRCYISFPIKRQLIILK